MRLYVETWPLQKFILSTMQSVYALYVHIYLLLILTFETSVQYLLKLPKRPDVGYILSERRLNATNSQAKLLQY